VTRDEFNAFCGGMTATTHVVQWGNADVWKVGGKVFAICGWNSGVDAFTFKSPKSRLKYCKTHQVCGPLLIWRRAV